PAGQLLVALPSSEAGPRGLPPALPDLPRVVTLSEDAVPGARVAEVTVSCSNASGSPNVTLHGIEPGHPFNSIAVGADPAAATTFRAEFRLRNHDTPLMLTRRGLVLAPDGGFNPSKETQTFRLEIEVTDRHGHHCSGAVRVETRPCHAACLCRSEPQRAVTVQEGTGPLEVVTQVHASGDNVRYAILAPTAPALFTINEMTGEIRSTRRLEGARAYLLVQAYNALHPTDHDTVTLNITVQGTDRRALSCVPAISVSQVPETVSPGSTLDTLRCTDPAGAKGLLNYTLEGPPISLSRFHMEGPRLQVNTTLDYDSEAVATMGFQFTATIVVTAVPNQAPVCTPEVQELHITAGLGSRQPVTRLACQGSPDTRSTLVPPTTTTIQHTMLRKEPLVVTRTEAVWHPPAWFVAVMTISGALLVAALGCVAWSLLCSNRDTGKLLLGKSSWDLAEQRVGKEERGHPHTGSPGQFDGRAQDP
ncbi:PREDICTED: cadherin-related family member 4, partial [Tauraco erythrolophus]|uniref:cadherin-related family member 4 n=1 Tax=Tauraco erythrolophus TaxID=121530 RepID=UPI000523BEB8